MPYEERILEERRRRVVHEHRQVAGESGNVSDVALLHGRNQGRIDILIADAVSEDVDPRVE